MSVVKISGLVKRHGSVAAVAGIDLEVSDGELVVLLGPSGCGKTTTLRCLAGLEDPTEGEIHIDGKLVSSFSFKLPPEKRSVGMVFQSYALWPHMTVAENLSFGLKLRGLPGADIARKVDETLQLVGLQSFGKRNAGELSGGQQQRVALARAIVLEPDILLFDEPLSNLDAKMRERMRVEIRALQKRLGITAIYVTHDQQEAMVIADRVVLMNAGRIEQVSSPRDLYERPASHFAAEFIGSTNTFTATVQSAGAGVVTVDVDGVAFECAALAPHRPGDRVDMLIRPEHVRIYDSAPRGPNVFQGRVRDSLFLGNFGEICVDSVAGDLRVQLSPPGRQVLGQAVWLQVDPQAIVVLPSGVAGGPA